MIRLDLQTRFGTSRVEVIIWKQKSVVVERIVWGRDEMRVCDHAGWMILVEQGAKIVAESITGQPVTCQSRIDHELIMNGFSLVQI